MKGFVLIPLETRRGWKRRREDSIREAFKQYQVMPPTEEERENLRALAAGARLSGRPQRVRPA